MKKLIENNKILLLTIVLMIGVLTTLFLLFYNMSSETSPFTTITILFFNGIVTLGLFTIIFYLLSIQQREETPPQDNSNTNFIANISHELRTPLTGILGFTTLLRETKLDEEQSGFLTTIEKSSNNLLHLVNDILDFSKVSVGKMEIDNHSFDIMEKMESTIDTYIAKVAEKYIELGLYIDPTIPQKIIGDSRKISQVLLNLLSNAIKFTPEQGLVNISITKIAENSKEIELKFAVKDSGVGIKEEKIEKIFEAFTQAENSTSREFGGTGLGLTISSKFVSLMGGKLEIESKENIGTTFFFKLKLQKDRISPARKTPQLSGKEIAYIVPKNEMRYRLIDDNLKAYISSTYANYQVYTHQEFFELKKLPDILFVNHRYMLEEGILERVINLDVEIILMSCADSERISSLYSSNVHNFIFKPINYSKVMMALNEKISSKEKKVSTNKLNQKLRKGKILVADDNLINQKLMRHILEKLDMDITIVNNGVEAFESYKRETYDLILMDIEMPIMTGVEATQKIRAHEKREGNPATSIIALTAHNSQSKITQYLASGMDDYLTKPINLDKLKKKLIEYISEETAPETTQQSKNVLIYKEDKISKKIYISMLESEGYKVDSCTTKDEFEYQLSSANKYQFILYDTESFDKSSETENLCQRLKRVDSKSFAFTKNSSYNSCSTIFKPNLYGKELKETLERLGSY